MIKDSDRNIILGVDGGITRENISEIAATGADLIVTGSAVFDGKARRPTQYAGSGGGGEEEFHDVGKACRPVRGRGATLER